MLDSMAGLLLSALYIHITLEDIWKLLLIEVNDNFL